MSCCTKRISQLGRRGLFIVLVLSLLLSTLMPASRAVALAPIAVGGELHAGAAVFLPLIHTPRPTEFWMSPSATDPLLLRAIRPDGITVDYFGSRTDDGTPTALDFVNVTEDGETTSITFAEQKPKTIQTADGSKFEIVWVSETEIRMKAISANGQYEASIPVDLANPEASLKAATALVTTGDTRAPCLDGSDSLRVITHDQHEQGEVPLVESPATVEDIPPVTVNVSKCSQPYDPGVVKVKFEGFWNGGFVDYPAQRIDTGVYQARVPDLDRSAPIGETCMAAVSVLDNTCTVLSTMNPGEIALTCSAIGAAVTVVGTPAAGAAVTAACGTALGATMIYCETLGNDFGTGAPSLGERICDVVEELEEGPDTIGLSALAYDSATQQWLYGAKQMVQRPGPIPNLSVAFEPSATSIDWVATFPLDPIPGDGYQVSAFVFPCLSATVQSVNVTISVVGSDGYTDSDTIPILEASEVGLFVPGAEQNVRDTITISVEGGPSKTFSVVF